MRILKSIVCGVAVGSLGLAAVAQPPAGGKPTTPPAGGGAGGGEHQPPRGPAARPQTPADSEKAHAAWTIEATGVAKRINANDDQTKAIVKAYTEARTSHQAAIEKVRKEQADKRAKEGGGGDDGAGGGRGRGGGAEMRKAMEDLNTSEREKFQKALGSAVPADMATKAVASLGTFNPMWDRMAESIADFKLEPAKQQTALNAIEDFVVAQSKARPAGGPGAGGPTEEQRTAMQEARQKLEAALKPVLSEEQMKTFQDSMRMGGGRGRGGDGGDGAQPPRRGRGGGDGGGQK